MSDRLKEKLGEDLYKQVLEKGIKASEIDLVDGWIPKQRFDDKIKENKILSDKIKDFEKKDLEVEKLLKDNKDLKKSFDDLNASTKVELENKDKQISNITKISKAENKLRSEGAKYPDLLMSKLNLDSLTIDGENLIGLDDAVKKLKDDFSDMFITKETNSNTPPNPSGTPPNTENIGNDGFPEGDFDWKGFADKLV